MGKHNIISDMFVSTLVRTFLAALLAIALARCRLKKIKDDVNGDIATGAILVNAIPVVWSALS